MAARYRIFPDQRLVVITVTGPLTCKEILDDRLRLEKEPDFDPKFNQLIDLRHADNQNVDFDNVNQLAQASLFQSDIRKAIVAPTDLSFGKSRMYEALSSPLGQQVEVFRSIRKALEFLGLPAQFLEEVGDGD